MKCPLILVVLLVTSCVETWQPGATVQSASGIRVCAKHHIPLVTQRGFSAPPHYASRELTDPQQRSIYILPYPNRIPPNQSLRPTPIMRIPTSVTYCPMCEGEVDELRDTLSSNQTMKLTATVMRFGDTVLTASFPSPQIGLSLSGRSLSFFR